MKVLIMAGIKTGNIVSTVKRKYTAGDVDIFSKQYISWINSVFEQGDFFDRAIILEEGIAASGMSDTDTARTNISDFVKTVQQKCSKDTTFVWVATTAESARMISEETLGLYGRSITLVRDPAEKLVTSFFVNIISNTLDAIHPDLVFNVNDKRGQQADYTADDIEFSETGDRGSLTPVQELDMSAFAIGDTPAQDAATTGVNIDNLVSRAKDRPQKKPAQQRAEKASAPEQNIQQPVQDVQGMNSNIPDTFSMPSGQPENSQKKGPAVSLKTAPVRPAARQGNTIPASAESETENEQSQQQVQLDTAQDQQGYPDMFSGGSMFTQQQDAEAVPQNTPTQDFTVQQPQYAPEPDYSTVPQQSIYQQEAQQDEQVQQTVMPEYGNIYEDNSAVQYQTDQPQEEPVPPMQQNEPVQQPYTADFTAEQEAQQTYTAPEQDQPEEAPVQEDYSNLFGITDQPEQQDMYTEQPEQPEQPDDSLDQYTLNFDNVPSDDQPEQDPLMQELFGTAAPDEPEYNNAYQDNAQQPQNDIAGMFGVENTSDYAQNGPQANFAADEDNYTAGYENPAQGQSDANMGTEQEDRLSQLFRDDEEEAPPEPETQPAQQKRGRKKQDSTQLATKKGIFGGAFKGKGGTGNLKNTVCDILVTYRGRGGIITVTGPQSSGKTTVAANIANLISKLGFSVLLVDMDTRQKAVSAINRNFYEVIHSIDTANPSLKQAINSSYSDIGKFVNIITPTLHVLGLGLASDIFEGDRLASRTKLSKFLNMARSNYCITVYDIPMRDAGNYAADIVAASDHIIIMSEYSNYGALNLMLELANLDSEEVESVMFSRGQVCLNKVQDTKLKSVLGRVTHGTGDFLKNIDKELSALLGTMPDYSFSEMLLSGEIPYDTRNDALWYTSKLISDTSDGWNLYMELLYSVLLKRG